MKNDELENARVKYQAALDLFKSEGQIQWARYSAMLLINTILVSIFWINKEANFPLLNQIIPLVLIIGLVLCILWFFMTWKGFHWINFWMLQANQLESQLKDLKDINPVMEGDKERKKFCKFCKTEYASYLIIILLSSIYFYILFKIYSENPLLFIGYGIFCFIIGLLSDN